MKRIFATFAFLLLAALTGTSAEKDTRCFEMRTYYAADGKLDDLNTRFRDHTMRLFEKHGIQNIGYWMPIDNPDHKLIYILAYPSKEAREKSWKEFTSDPDWQAAKKASEANGGLVTKVEQVFMEATDYSPKAEPSKGNEPRTFELRIYTAAPEKLDTLNARFRDHTVSLFKKHGLTNFAYWTPMTGQKGAENTLIYILAAPSKEARDKSFKEFGSDPDWNAAKKASEANGPLTIQNGVKSTFMAPTDYSPTK